MDKQTPENRRTAKTLAKKFASSMTGVPVDQIKRGSHPVAGAPSRKSVPKKGKAK
jgi:hypothetical protein